MSLDSSIEIVQSRGVSIGSFPTSSGTCFQLSLRRRPTVENKLHYIRGRSEEPCQHNGACKQFNSIKIEQVIRGKVLHTYIHLPNKRFRFAIKRKDNLTVIPCSWTKHISSVVVLWGGVPCLSVETNMGHWFNFRSHYMIGSELFRLGHPKRSHDTWWWWEVGGGFRGPQDTHRTGAFNKCSPNYSNIDTRNMIRGDTGNIKSRSIYYELIQIAGTHFIHAQHCNKLAKKEHLHAAQVGTHTNIHPDSWDSSGSYTSSTWIAIMWLWWVVQCQPMNGATKGILTIILLFCLCILVVPWSMGFCVKFHVNQTHFDQCCGLY